MGKRGKWALRVNFDGKLKLKFHGTMISSDAGLLVYRELDETFALTAGLKNMIEETRTGKNIQYSFTVLQGPYQQPNEETFQFVYCDILSKRIRETCLPEKVLQTARLLTNLFVGEPWLKTRKYAVNAGPKVSLKATSV